MSYVSPIEMAAKEARIEAENGVYKAVIEAGFMVDKGKRFTTKNLKTLTRKTS